MNVWTYWSGPKPWWIDVCLNSMKKRCRRSEFHLLTPENLPEDLDLDPRWLALAPGVGTDCLRAALLAQYGGLWIDADTVMVKDPYYLTYQRHDPRQFLYSRWSAPPDRALAGYVYCPKGHPIALQWKSAVDAALEHSETVGWGSLGENTLTPIVNRSMSPRSSWQIPIETFLPIDIDVNVKRFFSLSGWKDFMTYDTLAFGLNYSWMKANRESELNERVKCADMMIHRLLTDVERNDA